MVPLFLFILLLLGRSIAFTPISPPLFWSMFNLHLTCDSADSICEWYYLLVQDDSGAASVGCTWHVTTQGAQFGAPASRAAFAELPCENDSLKGRQLRTSAGWETNSSVVLAVVDNSTNRVAWFGYDGDASGAGAETRFEQAAVQATVLAMGPATPTSTTPASGPTSTAK